MEGSEQPGLDIELKNQQVGEVLPIAQGKKNDQEEEYSILGKDTGQSRLWFCQL